MTQQGDVESWDTSWLPGWLTDGGSLPAPAAATTVAAPPTVRSAPPAAPARAVRHRVLAAT
ncbi:MAG: hypothetical protein JWQ53_486, partial [Klenkia sp.]|nr:hypothetical protein [Klenkia sp.]